MLGSESLFKFADKPVEPKNKQKSWKILTVEDDINYQQALLNSFKTIAIGDDYTLEILTASSVSEASVVLSHNKDIALIFIDIVMEEDDAGLRLVNTIRNVLGNNEIRVVLLTGQPSFAPEREVMESLDIDEYWNKSDITIEKLQTIVLSHIRTYQYISQISNAKQGLQLVLDAARSINSKHDIKSYSRAVLDEIGKILRISDGGGVLCSHNEQNPKSVPKVITSNGCFKELDGQVLAEDTLDEEIYFNVQQAILTKEHVFSENFSVFYFDMPKLDVNQYITIVKSDNPIDEQNIFLLKVFSENVSTGFSNIALLNRLTDLAYMDLTLDIPNNNWLMREIETMNVQEQQEAHLLIFELLHYDEKSFSFGFDFCKKTHAKMHQNIKQALSDYHPRIALFNKDSLGVLVSNNALEEPGLVESLKRQTFEIDGVKQFLDVRILAVRLASLMSKTAGQIFNLIESTLSQNNVKTAELLHYSPNSTDAITRRYALLQSLRSAIRYHELKVALQPKIDLRTNEVVGFEALARWQLADGSFIAPDEFIELAETAGLISELDKLIFDKILSTIGAFKEQGYSLPIAFNASTYDLLSADYFTEIESKLAISNISTSLLELEVTETQAINNYEKINISLSRFADLGIKISIDDFGTGYSSLEHISEIPAQVIKIDRCFISNLKGSESKQHIIEMIMMLAKKFGFEVTAEGVESEYEHNWLKELGCHFAQGYYYSKPMFYNDALTWLKNKTSVNK